MRKEGGNPCGVSLRDTYFWVWVRNRDFCVYSKGRKLIIPVDYWLQIQICACVSQTTIRREVWTFQQLWWECEMVLPFWKAVWQFLKISNLESPHDPEIPLLWINPNTCAHMFTAVQFLTPKRGKPPKWPSISDQTDTHNGINSHSGIWLSHEKERSSDTGYDVDGPWTHNTQWEKADTERHTARDSIYRKCPKQAKPQRMTVGLWWLGARGGGWMDGWMDGWMWKIVAEPRKTQGFLASGGEEFNPGPEMRLDHSELLCIRVY